MKIYDHKYMSFDLKADRIDFAWKAETEDMDDHGFQYSILRYPSYVMAYNTKKVLIDLTNFKFNPGEASGQFHSDCVTRIYNMMGVTRKVFVAPFRENQVVGKQPGTDYDNTIMKTYDEAVEWLDA